MNEDLFGGSLRAITSEDRCDRCDGCGKIASSKGGEPWTFWLNLPLKSAAAVWLGLVKPLTCPDCKGSGKAVRS